MARHDHLPTFHERPRERCRLEAVAFYRVFRFHDDNNHVRKAVTLMVVTVWGILEIINAAPGLVAGEVMLPSEFAWLRLFVGLLLARMWDIELTNFTDATLRGDDSE